MVYRRIRDLREDRDLTQADVASVLRCTQQAYSLYESGRRALPVEVLIQLARFYGVSTDYLLNLTDLPSPDDRKGK